MPAEIYLHGTLFMLITLSPIIMCFAVNFIYLPVFWKLQVTSIFEYFEMRFDKSIRTIASCLFTVNNIVFLPVVIYAPSLAFNQGKLWNFKKKSFCLISLVCFQ